MKKLMLILIMLVIAISIYSETLSEYWDNLTREERLEIIEIGKAVKDGTIIIDTIEYELIEDGDNIILIPVYPEGNEYYLLTIGGILFELEFPEFTFSRPKPKIEDYIVPCVVTAAVFFVVGFLVNN